MATRLFLSSQSLHVSRQSDRLVTISLIRELQSRYHNNHFSLLWDDTATLFHRIVSLTLASLSDSANDVVFSSLG